MPQRLGDPARDRGQATVELALAMPVLCLLLLGVVQFAVVIRDQLSVIEAARVGARAASVSMNPGAAAAAAVGSGSEAVRNSAAVNGDYVTVTASMLSRTEVPLIGLLLGDVRVSASATMILEPP